MNSKKTKSTIVTILIVVVILGLLAVFIPQTTTGPHYSKRSHLTTNLQSIRAQLELYKLHHNGEYPTDITDGLTKKTDSDGTLNASGAYGPYMQHFPANPYAADPARATNTTSVAGAAGDGWFYNPRTGVLRANTTGHGAL
jgi:general secretion pathway protein G